MDKFNKILYKLTSYIPFIRKRRKNIKYCRDLWDGSIEKIRDFEYISLLHYYKKDETKADIVNDATWNDLDMDAIFSKIDYTTSSIGQQVLYDQLRTYKPKNDAEKETYHSELKFFIDNKQIREKLQLLLLQMNSEAVYDLPHLIYGNLPEKPRFFFLSEIVSFLSFTFTFLSIINTSFIIPLLFIIILNVIGFFTFSKNIEVNLPSIQILFNLLKLSIKISNIKELKNITGIKVLKKKKAFITKMTKGLKIILADPKKSDELRTMLYFYLNFAYQLSLMVFFNLRKRLGKNKDNMLVIIEAIGQIDAQISIASFLNRTESYCIPKNNNFNRIKFDSVYHPLLEKPVPNTIDLDNKSILITGSNMAGKTTFIKIIGLNMILDQTLYFCFAKEADIPYLIIKSMFKREDSIEEGKSYYFTEVEKIGEFLELCANRKDILFLVDEVFKGTNTIERIAASKAVLEYMSKYNCTFTTTHDVELQELLKEKYLMYNFSEVIIDNKYTFDYLLKKGISKSRNAIKLLEISGYPAEVVQNAIDTVNNMDL